MAKISECGIVVVEGSDAMGKTTLIREALNTWAKGGLYLHCTYKRTPQAIERHLTRMFLLAVRGLLRGQWVFLDRWWPSDAVYAPAYGRPRISIELCHLFDTLLRDTHAGGYVFAYDPDYEDTIARHARMSTIRPEMYSNISDVAKHYTQFCQGQRAVGHLNSRFPRIQSIMPFAHIRGTPTFRQHCYMLRAEQTPFECLSAALPKFFNLNERRFF